MFYTHPWLNQCGPRSGNRGPGWDGGILSCWIWYSNIESMFPMSARSVYSFIVMESDINILQFSISFMVSRNYVIKEVWIMSSKWRTCNFIFVVCGGGGVRPRPFIKKNMWTSNALSKIVTFFIRHVHLCTCPSCLLEGINVSKGATVWSTDSLTEGQTNREVEADFLILDKTACH